MGSENKHQCSRERPHESESTYIILRQTTEKERLHVLQVIDLSVLAAASFRIVITLSLLFLSAPPPPLYSKGDSACAAFSYLIGVYFL